MIIIHIGAGEGIPLFGCHAQWLPGALLALVEELQPHLCEHYLLFNKLLRTIGARNALAKKQETR